MTEPLSSQHLDAIKEAVQPVVHDAVQPVVDETNVSISALTRSLTSLEASVSRLATREEPHLLPRAPILALLVAVFIIQAFLAISFIQDKNISYGNRDMIRCVLSLQQPVQTAALVGCVK